MMETQNTEETPEFYFQTHDADPGQVKDVLDKICGEGNYSLKMVGVDRWFLITPKHLSAADQSLIRESGSMPDDGTPDLETQRSPRRAESFYYMPMRTTRTSASQQSAQARQASALAAIVANVWSKLRRGRRDETLGSPTLGSPTLEPYSNMVASPTANTTTVQLFAKW